MYTSRIIAYCCGSIAAVLPIRNNISCKNKRKKIKNYHIAAVSIENPQQYGLNENFLKFFDQTYCCDF